MPTAGSSRRRGRRDRAVELSADARVVEGSSGPGLGQHGRAQARGGHPGVRHLDGQAGPAGGAAAGSAERAARLRSRLGGLRAHRAPRDRPHHLHRRVRHRPRHLRRRGRNLVPVSLELGGKGANIVFDDADLANAVDWSVRRPSAMPGRCAWPARLYVQRGVYPEFLERLATAAESMVIGDPKDPQTQLGRWRRWSTTRRCGRTWTARCRRRHGRDRRWARPRLGHPADDRWLGAPPQARICREEVFGPVVTVAPSTPRPRQWRRRTIRPTA